MKIKLYTLFAAITLFPFFLSAQSLEWKTKISATGDPLGVPFAEFKATAVGPDGRIYSTGYFCGFRAQIGNTIMKADSLGFVQYMLQTPNPPQIPASIFVTCHEANGSVAWAHTITSKQGYRSEEISNFGKSWISGNKLSFDAQGNILFAGFIFGDTLSYSGVPFEFQSNPTAPGTGLPRLVVAKISTSGSLVWGHSHAGTVGLPLYAREIRYFDNTIEVMTNGLTTQTASWSVLRYSDSGTLLSNPIYQAQFPGASTGWLYNTLRFSDGRYLTSFLLTVPLGGDMTTVITLLNPDFSTISHHKIKLIEATQGFTGLTFPQSASILPDGQIGLFLGLDLSSGYPDWKLILDEDTLDMNGLSLSTSVMSTPQGTIFVRLSDPGCMKNVKSFDFISYGENTTSANGNFVVLNVKDYPEVGGDTTLKLRQLDRNGNILNTVQLGNLGASFVNNDEGPGNSRHSLAPMSGGVAGTFGSWLFKASLPDPVVADQSFSGCLSNRNLLLANEETLRPDPVARVFESQPGNWEIHGLPANGARYQLMSAQGKTLLSGSSTTETARFKTASLPVGMYYLHINDEKGLSQTLRVVTMH